MSSKRDTDFIITLLNNLVINLSTNEYENLLNGTATFEYVEKSITIKEKDFYDDILRTLSCREEDLISIISDVLRQADIDTKKDLLKFCDYLSIATRTRDTKEDLYLKVIDYVIGNKEWLCKKQKRSDSISNQISNIAFQLEGYNSEEAARDFLFNEKILEIKNNIVLLAKSLDVNIKKLSNNEEMINRIIDSVVGSKIRAKAIRDGRKGLQS